MPDTIFNTHASRIERLKTYFGIGLPIREMDLDFPQVSNSKRTQKPQTSIMAVQRDLKSAGKNTLNLLKTIKNHLVELNAYPVSHHARTKISQYYWRQAYLVSQKLAKQFSKNGVVPDNAKRAQYLDLACEVIDQLRRSYQFCFAYYYDLPNWRYGRYRERLYEISFCLAEIVQLQQQLSALRYRDLNATTWKCLNKIYYVMNEYESTEVPIELTRSRANPNVAVVKETLKEIYVRIQLTAYLDPLRFPVENQRFLNIYIRTKAESLVVSKLEQGAFLGKDGLVIGCDQESAPEIQSEVSSRYPANTQISIKTVKADLQCIHEDLKIPSDKHNQFLVRSESFRKIPPKNRVSTFDHLYRRVKQDGNKFNGYSTRTAVNLLVYSGFLDCYELKLDDKRAQKRVLRNHLAERSAFIGEDETAEVESLWYCLFNDKNTMLIQTQETQYTIKMMVGCLIAFSYKDKKDDPPIFASVSKIERLGNDQVNLELTKVADHAEAVIITIAPEEGMGGEAKKYPALFVDYPKGGQIILHHSCISKRMSTFTLERDKQTFPVSIAKRALAAEEFSVFDINDEQGNPFCLKTLASKTSQ